MSLLSRSKCGETRNVPNTGLDFYPTHPGVTRLFLSALANDIGTVPIISAPCIEPAAGRGHMAVVLQEQFKTVYTSDIKGYGFPLDMTFDFTSALDRHIMAATIRAAGWELPNVWLVTNPPFNRAAEFILGAMDMGIENIAILARLNFMEGQGRYNSIFSKHPPQLIYQYVRRIAFAEGKLPPDMSGRFAFAWFVWHKIYEQDDPRGGRYGGPHMRWIDGDPRDCTYGDDDKGLQCDMISQQGEQQ